MVRDWFTFRIVKTVDESPHQGNITRRENIPGAVCIPPRTVPQSRWEFESRSAWSEYCGIWLWSTVAPITLWLREEWTWRIDFSICPGRFFANNALMIIAASVLSAFNIRSPDAEKLRNDQLNLSEKLMTSGIIRSVCAHFEREDTALSKLDFVLAIRVRLIVASSQGPKMRLILFTGTRKRVRH